MEDIVQTAIRAGSFKTLVKAVTAAGLVETLTSPGPFTVFAPTDEAFAKLPAHVLEDLLKPENKDKLAAILTYHVIPGRTTAAQVTGLSSAETVNGKALSFGLKEGAVRVGGAKLLQADIVASNGVIHVIDAVVVPT